MRHFEFIFRTFMELLKYNSNTKKKKYLDIHVRIQRERGEEVQNNRVDSVFSKAHSPTFCYAVLLYPALDIYLPVLTMLKVT